MDEFLHANAVLSVFSKTYMDLKSRLPIRPSEMGIINIITSTDGAHTPARLAEMLNVSRPMVAAHIASLEQQEYITKSVSETDRRVYYIEPTAKALELAKVARIDLDRILARMANDMGDLDFHTFLTLAEKATATLKSYQKEQN